MARASRPYYSLIGRERLPGDLPPWGVMFGDYDAETVQSELDEMRESGWKARDLRIITTGAKQAEIDSAVLALNAKESAHV